MPATTRPWLRQRRAIHSGRSGKVATNTRLNIAVSINDFENSFTLLNCTKMPGKALLFHLNRAATKTGAGMVPSLFRGKIEPLSCFFKQLHIRFRHLQPKGETLIVGSHFSGSPTSAARVVTIEIADFNRAESSRNANEQMYLLNWSALPIDCAKDWRTAMSQDYFPRPRVSFGYSPNECPAPPGINHTTAS